MHFQMLDNVVENTKSTRNIWGGRVGCSRDKENRLTRQFDDQHQTKRRILLKTVV